MTTDALLRTLAVCAAVAILAAPYYGVVADSVPEREWQETWDKASGILLAADRFATSPPKQRPLTGSCVASP